MAPVPTAEEAIALLVVGLVLGVLLALLLAGGPPRT